MAAFKCILLVAALLGAASASRLELNAFSEVLQEAESGVEQYMESLIGKDRPDKDAEAVILTKYIVSPDRGLDFIKAFKLLKDAALELDGKPAIYALSKTKTDNILYYSYVAFETYKDLAEHLKQDATKKFIKFTAEEKIPVFTSPVITVE